MSLLVLIVLVLVVLGALPTWRHSRDWGYGPSGGAGVLLAVLVVMLFFNVIPRGF